MSILIAGLLIFVAAHSVRIGADGWRSTQILKLGEKRWKGMVSVASLLGFGLIVWGFGLARAEPVVVWTPPPGMRHLSALFTLVAFILLAAAHASGNHIKAALGHPMVAGVAVWALGHLLANGRLADLVLFGAFLAWAIVDFLAARSRDRVAGSRYAQPTLTGNLKTVVIGITFWALFAFLLHGWLIGVKPFG